MSRLSVNKTYKLFIGGKFPRSESGRYHPLHNENDELLANIPLASCKDLREAVTAARKATSTWSTATPFLRSQILYRAAEMLEGRTSQFIEELTSMGVRKSAATKEIAVSTDLLVHYAGWCDKFQQIFSTVNPVSSPHFNFSMPESTGVVAIAAPTNSGLLGLCATIAPVIAGGNTCVVLAALSQPLCAITLAEALNTSDLPAGTVNILTGDRSELLRQIASHMDINALILCSNNKAERKLVQTHASDHVMRVNLQPDQPPTPSPYLINDLQETKTTWHPVGY